MNDRKKQLYEKLNLEKLKTEMEILTTRRKHFRVKLDSTDNEFNKWRQKKELREEFKNNILSEWYKIVENINKRLEEVWKKISKEKEIPSRNTKKNYKRDLVLCLTINLNTKSTTSKSHKDKQLSSKQQ